MQLYLNHCLTSGG